MTRKIKTSVFVATSIDGYIARKDGSIDWLNQASAALPPGTDAGFNEFMKSVDVLIMGRKTFEQVLSFGEWPYGKTKMRVLSSKALSIPEHLKNTVEQTQKTPQEILTELGRAGYTHAYVDGATTIQSFLKAKLIDEITMTLIPVALGEGIPLFGDLTEDLILLHQKTKVYAFGYVQITYVVER